MNQTSKAMQAVSKVKVRPMSQEVVEVRKHINLIQEAMKATMKKDVHYGVIPGCQKPTLYKAGAEVILALFKLSTDAIVDDLSKDGEIRYRVKVNVTNREGGFLGSGIGECSSGEEKYMWRAAVCDEEFESFSESMRRIKFKKRYGKVDQIPQVRVHPGDLANTILKMGKKRAMIDAVLSLGVSDIFHQDLEDLPEGYIPPEVVPEPDPGQVQTEKAKAEIAEKVSPAEPSPDAISEKQRKRLYAIAMGAGMTKEVFKEWLMFTFEISSSKEIPWQKYDEICKKAEAWKSQ